MTPVIFKIEKDGSAPYAVFPTLPGDMNPATMTCYARLGQHGTAHSAYVRKCRLATPEEYAPLLKELKSVGYDDLQIRKRLSHKDYLARVNAIYEKE